MTVRPYSCISDFLYFRFVAIQNMCGSVRKEMTGVIEGIHLCIRDNPTKEEANEKIPQLVKEFMKKIQARKQPK
jgi:hypothetical protein